MLFPLYLQCRLQQIAVEEGLSEKQYKRYRAAMRRRARKGKPPVRMVIAAKAKVTTQQRALPKDLKKRSQQPYAPPAHPDSLHPNLHVFSIRMGRYATQVISNESRVSHPGDLKRGKKEPYRVK